MFIVDRVKLILRCESWGGYDRAWMVDIVPSDQPLEVLHEVPPFGSPWRRFEGTYASVMDAVEATLGFIRGPCRIVCDVDDINETRDFHVRPLADWSVPGEGSRRIDLGNISPMGVITVNREELAL